MLLCLAGLRDALRVPSTGLACLNEQTAWLGCQTTTHEAVRLQGKTAQDVCLKGLVASKGHWQAHTVVVTSKAALWSGRSLFESLLAPLLV